VKVKKEKNTSGKIFVISGPSGSGKTTLLTSLIKDKKISKLLTKSCSVTTRPKRSKEKEGKDYFFVSKADFRNLVKTKKILEWTKYLGYYYGTPRGPLESQLARGKSLGLCLDLKGARILKKIYPENTITVFVLPPSLDVLKNRIQNRCRQTNKNEVTQRIGLARKELLATSSFDHCIMNQNLKVALRELKKIFFQAIKA